MSFASNPAARYKRPMTRRRFIFTAALIILLAAGLRLSGLVLVPPGLHYDEAANAQFVTAIAFDGYRPLFIEAYTGKEVLWFYLAAGLIRLAGPGAGDGIFVLRLASVFWGVLTVAATGWLVQRLYRTHKKRDWLALLAMALLATAFWHGVLSRITFRAISQPLMEALSVGLLWQGFQTVKRQHRQRWLVLAGLATGLSAYTYLAVRLFPIPLAAAWAMILIGERRRIGQWLVNLGIYGAAGLAALAPLGVFFLRHPDIFGTRIEQVAAGSLDEALNGWWAAFKMLFIQGDPLARFNIPGKPLMGPVIGGLFVIGFGLTVWGIFQKRQTKYAVEPADSLQQSVLIRARDVMLVMWMLVMLAPTALATGQPFPSHLRAIGVLPVMVIFPAVGIHRIVQFLRRALRSESLVGRWGLPGALAAVLVISGWQTERTTRQWGASAGLYYESEADVAALARYINTEQQPGDAVYLATEHYQHPTLAYLTNDYKPDNALFGGSALVLAPERDTLAAYVIRGAAPPKSWDQLLANYALSTPEGPDSAPQFAVYRIPAEATLVGIDPVTPVVDFGGAIWLEGAASQPAVAGTAISVDLLWRIESTPATSDYRITAEVCDQKERCWLKVSRDGIVRNGVNEAYPSDRWKPGERLLTHLEVPLPEGIPPGDYQLQVRVVSNSAPALAVLGNNGAFAGLTARIGPVQVKSNTSPDVSEVPVDERLNVPAGASIELLGVQMPVRTLHPGQPLSLTAYWHITGHIDDDRTVRILLDGEPISEGLTPVYHTYPTSHWQVGEAIGDPLSERLPVDIKAGEYELSLQLGQAEPVSIGTIRVEPSRGSFDLPDNLAPLTPAPVLGETVELMAYDLPTETFAPGNDLPLTVAWQALASLDASYTVFVHLVSPDGGNLAQVDRLPAIDGETYPTDQWVPGEIVVDTYRLAIPADAPPGTYRLRLGLYIPETGTRLDVPGSADDAIFLPVEVTIR